MTSQQCWGSFWSLTDCFYWRRVLLVLFLVEQNGVACWTSFLQNVKCCWWKAGINARFKDSVYIQLVIFPVVVKIVQIRHLKPVGVHVLCTYISEHFVSYLRSLILVGLFPTRARWLPLSSCLWNSNKLQAATRVLWEFVKFSWTRSFTVKLTESGSKSTDHSIPSLEIDKVMSLYCRLKKHKWRLPKNFW